MEAFIISILWKKKLSCEEIKSLVPGPMASKWQNGIWTHMHMS